MLLSVKQSKDEFSKEILFFAALVLYRKRKLSLGKAAELAGYKIAKNSGLNVIRILSVLLKAKDKGIIEEIKPLLDEMILRGRWYSKKVYESFLKKIGEL
ncbi:MAG: DUF3368 domain-containing protein [Aliifodinibius sp.]|nr:DUF3368 domain-containing protein [Fodinibius sp.]NIV02866.1 DUF3368 domain-containing protein [Phycisphaerae bacterium]NIV68778.1 DUF3368 domain-containing protein [Phycisphaerae bacterium]NIY30229.1 DUF3368 domain-containing protein [Fodinibius sp.]